MKFGAQGWTPDRLTNLTGRVFVVTGANGGAGYEATRLLLSKGAQVLMLNRSIERSEAALARLRLEFGKDVPVSFVQMDLAELDSVREAARCVLEALPQIDALICNAAIAQVAQRELTVDGFESQFGVNHLGHFLLCGRLFDRVERSQGRIVVVGSNAYRMGLRAIQFDDLSFEGNYTAWNAYAQSKLAQMMFAYELQRRVRAADKSVQVLVCHPGASRTNLLKDTASRFNKLLWAVLSRVIAQSAERGAWPEVMCATEDGLETERYYGPTRRLEMVGPVDECVLDAVALDEESARTLWTVSEQHTAFGWSP
ncbi:MAG: SDR family oxidoreductase [Myxococcota bacterium]